MGRKYKPINNRNMNKLSKPKAFEASESITTQSGIEISNLLRSAITVQTVILVGHDGKWHEISIIDLRIDEKIFLENSNLETVAEYLDLHNITLADMKIVTEEKRITHVLTHDDFQALSEKFPPHTYIQISKLNDHNVSAGGKASIDELTDWLKVCARDGLTISELIQSRQGTPRIEKEDISELVIDSKTECDTVPVPDRSVSISIFETLSPSKITEIHAIRSEQESIVNANPVIQITDKKTHGEAKKNLAILLSASTRINGKTGVFTLAKQFVNKFKSDFDAEGTAIEQLSRVPYNSQKKIIEDWDNRLLLQQQERIKQLCAVPFVFDGTQYSIGSLVVVQKDIENHTDVQWSEVIKQGESVALALEAAKNMQNEVLEAANEQIAELKAMLEKFLPKEEVVIPVTEDTAPETPNVWAGTSEAECVAQSTPTVTQLPSPENKLLNALDLAHLSVIEEADYIKYREGFVFALSRVSVSLQEVFDITDKTVVKSEEIKKLIEIWK